MALIITDNSFHSDSYTKLFQHSHFVVWDNNQDTITDEKVLTQVETLKEQKLQEIKEKANIILEQFNVTIIDNAKDQLDRYKAKYYVAKNIPEELELEATRLGKTTDELATEIITNYENALKDKALLLNKVDMYRVILNNLLIDIKNFKLIEDIMDYIGMKQQGNDPLEEIFTGIDERLK